MKGDGTINTIHVIRKSDVIPVNYIIPPNSKMWDELLEDKNEGALINYVQQYVAKLTGGDFNLAYRNSFPVVRRKYIEDGITETVRIYANWFQHKLAEPHIRKVNEQMSKELGCNYEGIQYGKLHYIWKRDGEEISCVNITAPWYTGIGGVDMKLIWETCHPENRYLGVDEARETVRRYFNNPHDEEFK